MTQEPTNAEHAAPAGGGIMAAAERQAAAAIANVIKQLRLPARTIDLRPLPFEGRWGFASSVCFGLANDEVMARLEKEGKLEGLSKKEAKALAADEVKQRVGELSQKIVKRLSTEEFATVEAVNGYINISLDPNTVAKQLLEEILGHGASYGAHPVTEERVMVEHSQPNTHKAFHVGHLRNTTIGVSISRILRAAGARVQDATYIGDIGAHVIKCLWCYENFHLGAEPADPAERGRWLGEIYAEADTRLNFRKDVVDLLLLLSTEDPQFIAAIDRMLKYVWRLRNDPSFDESALALDIAYLLGRFTSAQEVKVDMLLDERILVEIWPVLGEVLNDAVTNPRTFAPIEGMPEPTTTPEERLRRWKRLAAHMKEWWEASPRWGEEIKETFQRWETQDPEFVALWAETREWSLADFQRIFHELSATFEHWFYESEVEEPGKRIVEDLLARGIAEISDGLPVVKIDEKLGLKTETYRTIPILRSDGTTLYSTKDLALTKQKFEEFGIDRAIWVVDVRQSLYFQQIFKVLELWGFEEAEDAYHLPYEMVRLKEGVISSRKGNVPVYDDVRDAAVVRAYQIIEEKNPELDEHTKLLVAWQVAVGALKYAMLARDNNKMVTFDLEEALSFDGHASPYIQYAHARACRILEHAKVTPRALRKMLDEINFGDAVTPEELTLLQVLAKLPDEVLQAANEYRPLVIANYVYEVAQQFNNFYHACPVLQAKQPTKNARIVLVAATRQVLANGLDLLGIHAPRVM